MAADIGAKIGIEGEREFKAAISGINKDMAVLGSELQKVSAQFGTNADSMDALRAKQEVYNKQVDEHKKKIDTLRDALAKSAKEYGENDAKTKNWQIALNKAEAELAKTENTLGETTEKIENFGKESNDSGKKVEDAGKKAKKSGDNAEDGESGWSKLGSRLKKAGEIAAKAMAAMGAAAVAAGTALVAATKSGAEYADNVLTTATQTGIATDTLQEYMYAAELVDVSVETLSKSMAKQIKSMKAVQDGAKLSVEAYQALGVETANADGSLRNSQDVYWEVIDALGKIENETQRDALAMQILGKSAQELNPLIEAGAERMKELGAQAQEAGYVLSDNTLQAFGAFDDRMQELKTGAEAAKNALGTVLLPVLTTLAGDGVELISDFTNGIKDAGNDAEKLIDVFADALNSVVDKIVEYLPDMIDTGMKIIDSLIDGIMKNVPKIVESAVAIVTRLAEGLLDALPKLAKGAIEIIQYLAKALVEALPKMIPAAVETVVSLAEMIVDNIDKLVDSAVEIVLALTDGIVDALPILLEKAPIIVAKLAEAIIKAAPKLVEAAGEMLKSLYVGIWKSIPALYKSIGEVFTGLFEKVKEHYSNMASEAGESFRALFSISLDDTWADLTAWFSKTLEFFSNLPTTAQEWFERGKQAISDWWNESDRATESSGELTKSVADMSEAVNQGVLDWQTMLESSTNYAYASEKTSDVIDTQTKKIDNQTKRAVELGTEYRSLVKGLQDLESDITTSGVSLGDLSEIMLQTGTDVEALAKKINDFAEDTTNAFSKIEEKTAISLDEMMENLEYNQKAVADWTENLGILADRGLDEGLLKKLKEMGPEGAGYVRNLVEASDEEIQKLNAKLQQGAKQAVDSAVYELKKSYLLAKQAGSDFAAGFIAGMHEQEPEITYSASHIGALAASTLRVSLQEQSPSKVTRRIGEYFGEGLAVGMDSMRNRVNRVASRLASGAVGALATGVSAPMSTVTAAQTAQGSGVNVTIQNLSVRDESDVERVAQRLYTLQRRTSRSVGVLA